MAAAETPCTEEVPVDVPTEHSAEGEQTQQNQCACVCMCWGVCCMLYSMLLLMCVYMFFHLRPHLASDKKPDNVSFFGLTHVS